jgi:hypothetical protein
MAGSSDKALAAYLALFVSGAALQSFRELAVGVRATHPGAVLSWVFRGHRASDPNDPLLCLCMCACAAVCMSVHVRLCVCVHVSVDVRLCVCVQLCTNRAQWSLLHQLGSGTVTHSASQRRASFDGNAGTAPVMALLGPPCFGLGLAFLLTRATASLLHARLVFLVLRLPCTLQAPPPAPPPVTRPLLRMLEHLCGCCCCVQTVPLSWIVWRVRCSRRSPARPPPSSPSAGCVASSSGACVPRPVSWTRMWTFAPCASCGIGLWLAWARTRWPRRSQAAVEWRSRPPPAPPSAPVVASARWVVCTPRGLWLYACRAQCLRVGALCPRCGHAKHSVVSYVPAWGLPSVLHSKTVHQGGYGTGDPRHLGWCFAMPAAPPPLTLLLFLLLLLLFLRATC